MVGKQAWSIKNYRYVETYHFLALNPLMKPPMPISTLELSLGDVLL
jgi:hypothetical protein